MEKLASHRQRAGSEDLASIVLGTVGGRHAAGDRGAGRGAPLGPERVPVERGPQREQGYDARSVAVLALVVAVLAALGGWLTSVRDEPRAAPRASDPARSAAVGVASGRDEAVASPVAGPGSDTDQAVAPVRGLDLAMGQLTARRDAAGNGVVTVGVKNAGSLPYGDERGPATVLVLLDGEVVGTEPVQPLEPGGSTRVSLSLGQCPVGSVAVTAVLDPAAAVPEGDERNNATTRSLEFGC